MITREEFETYEKVRSNITSRTNEIFNLLKELKRIEVGWNEYYEGCNVDSCLEFKVGGNYRGEYDYEEYYRPIDYLFMTDEEIIKAEKKMGKAEIEEEEERKKEEEREERQRDFQMYNQLKEKLGL